MIGTSSPKAQRMRKTIQQLPVDRIRPEEGLGRRRDRDGHDELCQSIEKFGVLTPVTVRQDPDNPGHFILVKGQGRTLACSRLGLVTIPAIVVGTDFNDAEKVQQFLVENVARLKMRPIDRALLIRHSRNSGEETASVAQRFGISSMTVRRLEAQLDGATSAELAALQASNLSLSVHAVIARFVPIDEREEVIQILAMCGTKSGELALLFNALGWEQLVALGPESRSGRLTVLKWAAEELNTAPRGPWRDRLTFVASRLPIRLTASPRGEATA
jgi:ParB/RepB/Spo0J family partition protein